MVKKKLKKTIERTTMVFFLFHMQNKDLVIDKHIVNQFYYFNWDYFLGATLLGYTIPTFWPKKINLVNSLPTWLKNVSPNFI